MYRNVCVDLHIPRLKFMCESDVAWRLSEGMPIGQQLQTMNDR